MRAFAKNCRRWSTQRNAAGSTPRPAHCDAAVGAPVHDGRSRRRPAFPEDANYARLNHIRASKKPLMEHAARWHSMPSMRIGAQDSARECEKPNAAIAQSRFRIPAAALLSRCAKARAPLPLRKVRDAPVPVRSRLRRRVARLDAGPRRAGELRLPEGGGADRAVDLLRSATADAGRRARRCVRGLPAAFAGQGPCWRPGRAAVVARRAAEAVWGAHEGGRSRAGGALAHGALSRGDVPGAPRRTGRADGDTTALPQTAEPGFIHPACLWTIVEQD